MNNKISKMEKSELPTTDHTSDDTSKNLEKQHEIDGGAQAWLVLLGAWCALFCSFGWVSTIGVFQDHYQTYQLRNYSPSSIAWILSLEPFMLFLAGLLVGKLFDNFGPRWLLLIGTILHVFGVMMISISSEFYQFLLAQGICSPIGMSFIFYPALSCTATWFNKKRALAFGITSSGSSLGGIIFPAILPKLIPTVGFGWAVRICGFIMLGMLIVANLLTKSRIRPVPKTVTLSDYFSPFTETPFVLLAIASTFGFFSFFVPATYVILQAQTNGISPSVAGYLLAIFNAGSLPGRLIPGYLGDKFGRFNIMALVCSLSVLFILVLWLPGTLLDPDSVPVYVVFSVLFGFSSGGLVSMVPALLAQISPDLSKIGLRQGVLFTCLAVASLTAAPIGGAILNAQDGAFWGLQLFSGVMMVGAVAFYVVCRIVLAGASPTAKV